LFPANLLINITTGDYSIKTGCLKKGGQKEQIMPMYWPHFPAFAGVPDLDDLF